MVGNGEAKTKMEGEVAGFVLCKLQSCKLLVREAAARLLRREITQSKDKWGAST